MNMDRKRKASKNTTVILSVGIERSRLWEEEDLNEQISLVLNMVWHYQIGHVDEHGRAQGKALDVVSIGKIFDLKLHTKMKTSF